MLALLIPKTNIKFQLGFPPSFGSSNKYTHSHSKNENKTQAKPTNVLNCIRISNTNTFPFMLLQATSYKLAVYQLPNIMVVCFNLNAYSIFGAFAAVGNWKLHKYFETAHNEKKKKNKAKNIKTPNTGFWFISFFIFLLFFSYFMLLV